jgi:hypothetical protein
MNNTAIDAAAALRADRDHAAIARLGIITADETGNTQTFFAHGTELCESGKDQARADRADFLQLPTVEDGMAKLRRIVQSECRADHFVDLGGCYVDTLGRLVAERDTQTGSAIERLVPSEIGWQRLASFAPDSVPSKLRSNVNGWLGSRRGDEMRLRTRNMPAVVGPDGLPSQTDERELFAVVSPRYVPYDLDAIATDIEAHLPADARVRVRYDRSRSRIDAVLCNPHHFPDSTGAASVGEAHRLTLRITTADDGTGGFKLQWAAERIRCVNLTLLKGENTVLHANHTRADLVDTIQSALRAQGDVLEGFASAWRDAWQVYYLDTSKRGAAIDGPEALRRMVFHGLIKIPGLRKADVWSAVKGAWDTEPGDTVASVHNAITRAAHEAQSERSWADDDVEEQASSLLFQRVHVLRDIPEDERAELTW